MLTINNVSPLSSDKVQLVPLTSEHCQDFYQAGAHPSLWRWVTPNQCIDLVTATRWVKESLEKVALGEHIVFVIIDCESGKVVGSTRYCSIDHQNRGIEIGFTFISPLFQRSHINSHAKYLLLRHAFECFGAIRVQFKTHENNQKSRNAISRLGATFEGVIRHQRILDDGSFRNTAQFSITDDDDDWPLVKQRLENKMAGGDELPEEVALSDAALALMAREPLAQLGVASADNPLAQMIYIPMWFNRDKQVLVGHLSAHNKLNWLLENSPTINVVFNGGDAYISPLWHAEQVVPTWNYQRLHLSGRLTFVADDDSEKKLKLLAHQMSYLPQESWQVSSQPSTMLAGMVKHIRCFEIKINEYKLIEKVSRNRSITARETIASKLTEQGATELAKRHL